MLKWQLLAPLIAIGGGVVGIIAAIAEEGNFGGYFGVFVAAPIIEEAIKPVGVYFILAKWQHALRGRIYTAMLAALGGLSFAVIENTIYLQVYFPEHTQFLVLWRYTVSLLLHVGCSFVLGLGINQKLLDSVRGEIPFLKGNRKFFIIPMVTHACYNVLVFMLAERDLLPLG
jgi:RsiW-degrading membrane proteinase PrsW (M82 family)